ncbi:hypothetical protein CTAYLR_006550 [Chrysophaeum taylorii]|uniref:Amine oxidase domain-containing protein n=1 Tax=Chrysophaeum taylorii TaxID=2483200 RepID=A0AAD7UFH9_9STRA|nr:hypothetical protein CTAYLR_006550 [Chrysophaeum taylorii]
MWIVVWVVVVVVGVLVVDAILFRPLRPGAKRSRSLGKVPFAAAKVPRRVDTVVIGSGQGGLSCGSVLAQFGEKVVVVEQHEVSGGGAHCFAVEGRSKWRFDAGHHITIPLQEQLLHLACGTAAVPVAFDRTATQVGYSDTIALGEGPEGERSLPIRDDAQLAGELLSRFPDHQSQIRRYFDVAESVQLRFGILCAAAVFPMACRRWLVRSLALWREWAGITAAEGLRRLFPGTDEAACRLRSYLSGLWLDTGSPPSRGSFFMQTAVMGGWQKLGVSYPRGGPQLTTLAMVEAIELRGGVVFVSAPVTSIVCEGGVARGVQLASGDVISANRVVSAIGYRATEALLGRPTTGLATPQSSGFVMANIALRGTAAELGISAANVWIQPANRANGFDALKGCDAYLADPLGVDLSLVPAGITFPSLKELGPAVTDDAHHTCQILALAEYDWFAKYVPIQSTTSGARHSPPRVARVAQAEYDALKAKWAERLVALLHKAYPGTEGRVVFADISTPHTLETYLRTVRGAAVGLDVTPERFVSESELAELDMKHPRVANLWRCGQDYLMCGQVLAAASGVLCALRMRGPFDALRFVCRSDLAYPGSSNTWPAVLDALAGN